MNEESEELALCSAAKAAIDAAMVNEETTSILASVESALVKEYHRGAPTPTDVARIKATAVEAIRIELRSAAVAAIDDCLRDLGYTLEERDGMMDALLEELGQPR